MTTNTNGQMATKVRTGEVRLSYPHLFQPHAMNGGEAKYSVSLIIPKSDDTTIKKIENAIKEAITQGIPKWGGKKPATLKTPLRDGDLERPEDKAYTDAYFINATCKTRPGVVLKQRVGANFVEASEEDVYAGCYGIASVNFYAYNANGNRGIACGLNNIMKTKDGENLGGRISADSDFADIDFDDDDLLG